MPKKLFTGFMIFICTLIAILLFNMFVFGRGDAAPAPAQSPAAIQQAG